MVIDPMTLLFTGSSLSNHKVREQLSKLHKIAVTRKIAVLGLVHLTKKKDMQSPLSNVSGAQSLTTYPRVIAQTVKVKKPAMFDGAEFLFVPIKNTHHRLDRAFGYNLVTVNIVVDGVNVETSKVKWVGEFLGSPEELIRQAMKGESGSTSQLDAAVDFLNDFLGEGPVAFPEILEEAALLGISKSTLTRAKREIGIISRKQSGAGQSSHFLWSLP